MPTRRERSEGSDRPGRPEGRGSRAASRPGTTTALAALLGPLALIALLASPAVGVRFAPDDPRLRDPAELLRAAREASEAGQTESALWLLAEASKRHPLIADHADRLRARQLLAAGEPRRAAARVREALAAHPSTPQRPVLHGLLGRALEQAGDEAGARAAWGAALAERPDSELKGELLWQVASSLEKSDEVEAALPLWLELWTSLPGHARARDALARIETLERNGSGPLRDAAAWHERGRALYRLRHNELALEAFEEALAGELPQAARRRASQERARTLFRLRRYDQAVDAFAGLPQDDEVRLWHARSLARSGRVPDAVRRFEALAEESRGEIGVRSRYLAALLLSGKGHGARARQYFETVARDRSHDGLASAALWRLGWGAFREGDLGQARGRFEALVERERDPIGGLRARYWKVRVLERQGAEEAAGEFARLAREYPLSYYGWRAAARAPRPTEEGERAPLVPGRARLKPGELARARILLRAGLRDEAVDELHRLRRRARSLSDRLALAELLTEADDFNGAQRLMVDAYQQPLAQGPRPRFEEVWWYAWPTAFSELVRDATARPGSVEPELVYSIMREESGYRPAVISVSGARGLLQIMEPTGRRLARALGRPDFHADQLFDPRVNIGLGAHYLAELSRRFPARPAAAIASYNAGPTAVSSWVRRDPGVEEDVWVESIPYDQTRAYVKRVLRSLHAYRILY